MVHFAIQGHSRSPILVPIESSYMTSYQNDSLESTAHQVLNLYRRHSNGKLSIVMALSTNFTQYAPEITKFGNDNSHFSVQGHSRSPILVPIESS